MDTISYALVISAAVYLGAWTLERIARHVIGDTLVDKARDYVADGLTEIIGLLKGRT